MTITRAHLIESISRPIELPKGQCSQLLETLLELLMKTLESGEDVLISGFGKFYLREKKKRKGRAPVTRDNLTLKARRELNFQCSASLKDRINRNRRERTL